MANKPKEFPVFTKMDQSMIDRLTKICNTYLSDFSARYGINDIVTSKEVILEVFERIEKRRIYFHIFYNGCELGEINEGSLLCFWILKLHPFHCHAIATPILNTQIAIFLFFNMLYFYANQKGKKVNYTDQIFNDIFYAFCYRDMSKEAIMILAEGLLF